MIEDKLYVLSQSHLQFSPWIYHQKHPESDIIGSISDFTHSDHLLPQVTSSWISGGKKYTTPKTESVDCSRVQYVLPDTPTQKHFGVLPDFTYLSVIDLSGAQSSIDSTVIL